MLCLAWSVRVYFGLSAERWRDNARLGLWVSFGACIMRHKHRRHLSHSGEARQILLLDVTTPYFKFTGV